LNYKIPVTLPTWINMRIYFCYQCNVYIRYFCRRFYWNNLIYKKIRHIFNDSWCSVCEFPVWMSYTVTGTFLKLYFTDSFIASKHCAKFREPDAPCSSLIHYFTDCKHSFTKVIWQYERTLSCTNTDAASLSHLFITTNGQSNIMVKCGNEV